MNSCRHAIEKAVCRFLAGLATLAAVAIVVAAPGCKRAAPANVPPPRIVSFSPAVTDMLFQMGLGKHVVGVTSQCEPPEKRQVVGDAYSINTEAIAAVEPDIVMIQQQPERFETLRQVKPNVRIEHFDLETLADVAAALERVGKLAGQEALGVAARKSFERKLDDVRQSVSGKSKPMVLFVIAYEYDKPGTGGRNSFIHEMIELAGGVDAAGQYKRWADLDAEAILKMRPDVLVVWTRPGGEAKAREYWLGFPGLATPADRRFVVTDRNWTIPSSRLADLAGQLAGMIHPDGGVQGTGYRVQERRNNDRGQETATGSATTSSQAAEDSR